MKSFVIFITVFPVCWEVVLSLDRKMDGGWGMSCLLVESDPSAGFEGNELVLNDLLLSVGRNISKQRLVVGTKGVWVSCGSMY